VGTIGVGALLLASVSITAFGAGATIQEIMGLLFVHSPPYQPFIAKVKHASWALASAAGTAQERAMGDIRRPTTDESIERPRPDAQPR
jgi:hypothetical protein